MARQKDIDLGEGAVARPGRKRKHLKPYTTLYESNYRDVPATLRKIAKQIEEDKREITTAILILDVNNEEKPSVHGIGPSSSFDTMFMTLDWAKDAMVDAYKTGRKMAIDSRK